MLINDITLLRIEPRTFIDAATAATLITEAADGGVSGTTLSSASSDFAARGVDAGNVVVIGAEPVEVQARTSPTALTVSRPRVDDAALLLPPAAGSNLSFAVRSFARLIEFERAWALGALGIDADHPDEPLDEDAIVGPEPIERLIALRTIARAYEMASAAAPADAALAQRAVLYRGLARDAAHQAIAFLDLDGDGVPDATRRVNVFVPLRA